MAWCFVKHKDNFTLYILFSIRFHDMVSDYKDRNNFTCNLFFTYWLWLSLRFNIN